MSLKRELIWTGAVVVVVLLVHLLLLHGLTGSGVVASVFAAGDLGSAAVALIFVAVRFAALVLLPGWLLYRLVRIVFRATDAHKQG